MKKIFYLFIFELLALPFVSCQQRSNNPVSSVVDSVAVEPVSMGKTEIVDAFFKDFQEKNDGWTKTEAGHKKLAEAFKKKITSDIDFAKACATYNTEYQYTDNPITRSESISPYSKDDGEEGEIKAFDFDGNEVTIELDENLSGTENANKYYSLYKKSKKID